MTLTRRSLLRAAALGGAGLAVGARTAAARPLVGAPGADQTLRALAARSGRAFGVSAQLGPMLSDPAYATLVTTQARVFTPQNELKWVALRPTPTEHYSFGAADTAVRVARDAGLAVRGHCFTWANSNPSWFKDNLTRSNAARVLTDHITTVTTRYRGQIASWDVVNEAYGPVAMTPTPWLALLGPRYVDLAFRATREADPSAQLVLNEHQLECSPARQRAVLRALEGLLDRGVPVHALGTQAHLSVRQFERHFNPRGYRAFLREVGDLGLDVLVTELDVTDHDVAGSPAHRDRAVARVYRTFLDTALAEPAVTQVITWDLADKHSWLRHDPRFEREDGEPLRPLPYDDAFTAKSARHEMAAAFLRAPRR